MDAQWRWTHDAHPNKYGNCIQGNAWDTTVAKDGKEAASYCALEGMDLSSYETTYGVKPIPGGINLKYVNGQSVGSRLYMMEDETTYKMFKLLNREFTIDVDVSTLECGLNGAVYFVEMQADGGKSGAGNNTAGAKYGTGYCDAQCPHDLKFISGEGNVKGWHMTKTGPQGHYGSCCSEMDIWEANFASTAYTAHPCTTLGPERCEGDKQPNVCGDTPDDCNCCGRENCPCCGRYEGVCDKDGCDYNHWRLGDQTFFGKGPAFTVDATKPITVVTQFLTSDGTDTGDLTEIRRLYVQNGKVIPNSVASNLENFKGDSITGEFCTAQKKTFDNRDDFGPKGGLKAMGKALARGMVLVLSLWDDELTRMVWLDSATPTDNPKYPLAKPGVVRGPCPTSAGNPSELREQHPDVYVTYSNIKIGEIGSTYGAASAAPAQPPKQVAAQLIPWASVPIQPVATVPMAPVPFTAPLPTVQTGGSAARTSGAACCTSGKNGNDKCGTCWPGSEISSGWCAEHCGSCGGEWCANGIIFAVEEPLQGPILEASEAWFPRLIGLLACTLALVLLMGFIVTASRRLKCRRSRAQASDQLALCEDLQSLEEAPDAGSAPSQA